MNSQSTGRNQRPKGFKVKPALQIALFLAICFWLLYQVKNSHDNPVTEEHGSDILGRKGNSGWSNEGGISDSEDANLVGVSIKKEDGGGGDDVLVGNSEDKNEKESLNKVNGHAHGNVGSHEGKEIKKETYIQYNELKNTDDNSDIEVKGNDETVGIKENSLQEKNSRKGHEDPQASMLDQDGEKDEKNISHDQVGEDEEQKLQVHHDQQGDEKDPEKGPKVMEESSTNEFSVQLSERKNDSLLDPNSTVDGVHGFHDENGVPLVGNDLIESTVTVSSGDRAISLHQEVNSSSNNLSTTSESTVNGEFTSLEGSNGADFEDKSKISVEDSKIDGEPKVETSLETSSETSVHTDTSRINSVARTTQGGSSVSDS